ncbi:hypothetical protein [Micromonospora sp. CPCC 205556]|uniref:hypothetical protein n=1 Tax=Micromonospora sp. CPCC 205556 TaxID=3122398 RepID=UPI002FF42526
MAPAAADYPPPRRSAPAAVRPGTTADDPALDTRAGADLLHRLSQVAEAVAAVAGHGGPGGGGDGVVHGGAAGAHRFGIEVFEPATSNTLMAALLVHDLRTGGGPALAHPWQDEAYAAAHGGLWRVPYAPRSALGLAVLLGLGGARA